VTQDQFILLCFKAAEIAAVVTIAVFTAFYTWWTKGKCWTNPIGQTIVYEGLALILVLIPSILSIFIDFNRLTSHIAAWFDVGSFALVPIIMVWRIAVFRKIRKMGDGSASNAEDSKYNPLYCSVSRSAPAVLMTPPGR
jgi:hypothetical protein